MSETSSLNLFELITRLKVDTLTVSLPSFRPELVLCGTIVLLLLLRMPAMLRWLDSFYVALAGALVGFYFAAPWKFLLGDETIVRTEIFDGLLVYDPLTVFFRAVLLGFAALFIVFTRLSGIPDREDAADVYSLVLGATLGMCIMASANNLFVVFLGVEMASVPSYALAGILKGRRQSSEAALKYAIYGAATAGVMLYGISLLAGCTGSFHLPTIAATLADMPAAAWAERQTALALGGLMLAVGLAFKLSAVPFHFWCPDVFEGASAEVNAFLSVASKAAALALLIRVAIGFSHVPAPEALPAPVVSAAAQAADVPAIAAQTAAVQNASATNASATNVGLADADAAQSPAAAGPSNLTRVRNYIFGLVGLLAAITCTFGNLAAYGQTNIKRLLAYSTIAHAGYIMMPVAAAVLMIESAQPKVAQEAVAAICLYVVMYVFMNLGAFVVVALMRNTMRSEEISDYAGLIRTQPGIVICLSVILLSLLGLPPLAGFAAKFAVFRVLAADPRLYLLLAIGGLNTVLSLFYYLRVVKVMTLEPEPAERLPLSFSMLSPAGVFLVLVTLPVLVLGVWFDPLNRLAHAAVASLLS